MNAALLIIFAFAALAPGLGLRASHGKDMNLEQWARSLDAALARSSSSC
jgi:hypothetical protein